MQIPLTPDEVRTIAMASAHVNKTYHELFKSLAGLASEEEIISTGTQLVSLKAFVDILRDVREIAQDQSVLTDESLKNITLLRESIGKEFLAAQNLLTTKAAAALDTMPSTTINIPVLRHEIIGKINATTRMLDKMYEMADRKISALSLIRTDSSGRTP